jgi:hypothetical protein
MTRMLCVVFFSVHKGVQSRRQKIFCLLCALAFLFSGLPLSYTGVSGVQTRREAPAVDDTAYFCLSSVLVCGGFFLLCWTPFFSSTCLGFLRISPFVIFSKIGYPRTEDFPCHFVCRHLISPILFVPPLSFPWFVKIRSSVVDDGWGACVIRSTQRLKRETGEEK